MIECSNLEFNAGGRSVLAGISFTAEEGEILGIMGESGSGKTVLLKIAAGLLEGYSGEFLYHGTPVGTYLKEKRHEKLSYCGTAYPENADETVIDFLHLPRLPYKKFFKGFSDYDNQVVEDWLSLFGLSGLKNVPLRQLPDATIRRTVLAAAFIAEAATLILDDPTVFLDLSSVSKLHTALKKYAIKGDRTVLLGGNDINFLLQVADRVLVLSNGSVAFSGAPESVTREMIREIFGVDVLVSRNIYNGRPEIHRFPE